MNFRPCIDIHNGKVKQIVGGSLTDDKGASENFVADTDAASFAQLYKVNGLKGGHIILLNKSGTEEYEATKKQALMALSKYPGGLQIGGGITAENAKEFIEAGASHVIVTSYIFSNGVIDMEKLKLLNASVGRDRIVIDLSCRMKDCDYYVVTDRWQTFTDVRIQRELFEQLKEYCDEFLIHGVDVEGKRQGIDEYLLGLLADCCDAPVTYAGGVRDMEDIDSIEKFGRGRIDFTIGSALDIFGGDMNFEAVCRRVRE